MKVLFVCSGGTTGAPGAVVRNQGTSIERLGITIEYFCVKGRGVMSYFRSIAPLRRKIKTFKPDVVHAHYSFSAFLAFLAGARPLVISLMGSDAMKKWLLRFCTRKVSMLSELTIVKSAEMRRRLNLRRPIVIPNGVDTELFKPASREECIEKTGLNQGKINILFASNHSRPEKNYPLAKAAVELAQKNNPDIELTVLNSIETAMLPLYYNSAHILLLTSLWEGSPNVVKEAMACNLPVVSTDVGDVRKLIAGVCNSMICINSAEDVSRCICEVIARNERSDGRRKIFQLGLDSRSVAQKIKEEYAKVIIACKDV
ncbi:MAG: glycosyltransferase [Bacteroidales bacterium]|jgi:glycosyltransferase involved in cell wall biosynthesis|nr:glycosyltransferase [Bacteroidales bacterium]